MFLKALSSILLSLFFSSTFIPTAQAYRNQYDREQFLFTLSAVVKRYGWLCYAYCLLDNHYHLLIETPKANLSLGMRQLNGIYTQIFNRLHRRAGHLFQGRFKSILVEREAHLLELCRYVVLNPVLRKSFIDLLIKRRIFVLPP